MLRERAGESAHFVVNYSTSFFLFMTKLIQGSDGLRLLENYANKALAIARAHDKELTQKYLDDEDALTNHAWRMGSMGRKIVEMKEQVAKLKRTDTPALRLETLATMAYLEAQFKAMSCHL